MPPLNISDYDFAALPGLKSAEWTQPLYFVGTGMNGVYDLGWMSTSANRRDFDSGISGSHCAASPKTCFDELRLTEPYPRDSYCFTLTGGLRLLDLRSVESPAFSGDYYSADRAQSCRILEANRDYLNQNGYDGVLRYSQPLLASGIYSEVIALTPSAIGKLGVQEVQILGQPTVPLTIRLPDGGQITPPFPE